LASLEFEPEFGAQQATGIIRNTLQPGFIGEATFALGARFHPPLAIGATTIAIRAGPGLLQCLLHAGALRRVGLSLRGGVGGLWWLRA